MSVAFSTIKIWLNAFIPRDIPGLTTPAQGAHSDSTMIPGPIPGGDCFLTDNRDFDNTITASSRMHSEIKIDITTPFPVKTNEFHKCDTTRKIDCSTGDDTCTQNGDTSRMHFSDLRGPVTQFQFDLTGAANNPCFAGSPDIDYKGTFTVTVSTISVQNDDVKIDFNGFIDAFPAFEMYWTLDDGAGQKLFQVPPPPGNTPWNLPGDANTPITAHDEIARA